MEKLAVDDIQYFEIVFDASINGLYIVAEIYGSLHIIGGKNIFFHFFNILFVTFKNKMCVCVCLSVCLFFFFEILRIFVSSSQPLIYTKLLVYELNFLDKHVFINILF